MDVTVVLAALGSLIGGLVIGAGSLYFYRKVIEGNQKSEATKEADRIVNKAKAQANRIERDAKSRAKDFESRARRNVESDIRKQKQQLQNTENQMKNKESKLEKEFKQKEEEFQAQLRGLDSREDKLNIAEGRIKELEKQANEQIYALTSKLENIAGISSDDAKKELQKALEDEARREAADQLEEIEKSAEKDANSRARRILAVALSRYASEVATERTVSTIPLTSDEMKGKIIGREGRNIRALESACGVDLIIDETPESVVISSFDPVRREIARQTLEKLMEDGRVHPARIEEVVSKVKSELANTIKEDGEKAAFDLGLPSIHPAILNVIGGLKYRQTATQNLYKHSLEVAYVAGLLAAEIGADVKAARRAGLIHAVGKGIDHTFEGSFSKVGADFARRHGEKPHIVHAIRAVNNEEEAKSVLAHIVQAAHKFALSRPGTKRSMMENYIRRLEDLESVGNSFDGVSRTFAIQAGKEIRVMVDSGKITDDQAGMLSRDIARKIERELNYPGQIKVNVVRETRIVEHAR